jgi:hypothetical protein
VRGDWPTFLLPLCQAGWLAAVAGKAAAFSHQLIITHHNTAVAGWQLLLLPPQPAVLLPSVLLPWGARLLNCASHAAGAHTSYRSSTQAFMGAI